MGDQGVHESGVVSVSHLRPEITPPAVVRRSPTGLVDIQTIGIDISDDLTGGRGGKVRPDNKYGLTCVARVKRDRVSVD